MNKYQIRFNKTRGQEGRGTVDHVWRVFENGVEHLAQDVRLVGETFTECTQENGETKWNIACFGRLIWVDRTAVIVTDKD